MNSKKHRKKANATEHVRKQRQINERTDGFVNSTAKS